MEAGYPVGARQHSLLYCGGGRVGGSYGGRD